MLALISQPALAARGVTLYLDGAVVTREERAVGGYVEISIPPSAKAESLRIRPAKGTGIRRVQVVAKQPSKKLAKELTIIGERRELLQDRLKALAIREDIYRSAARSQSAKAPRKTKTNPDPLQSIRQGTDYAISQLESVFQAKRRAEKELKQLDEKQATLLRDEQSGGSLARVWVTPATGSVTAAYLDPKRCWQPVYELRTKGSDPASFSILPGQLQQRRDETVEVVFGSSAVQDKLPYWKVTDETAALKTMDLQVLRRNDSTALLPVLSLTLVNQTEFNLPPGAVSCYADGAYLGSAHFPGMDRGSSLDFRCGNN